MKTSAFHFLLLSMHDVRVYEKSKKQLKVSFTWIREIENDTRLDFYWRPIQYKKSKEMKEDFPLIFYMTNLLFTNKEKLKRTILYIESRMSAYMKY
jgi:hypothetical protein